jgi:multiple sugar transport system ATP-binding protein
VLDPEVLLLDEPLSNLDAALRETAMEELQRIHRQVGTTIIYVSHNQTEAMTLSDRIAIINSGRLEQYDTPRKVYDFPQTLFSASFIGNPTMNFFNGRICHQDDMVGVMTPIGFIRVEKEVDPFLKDLEKMEVKVGIRPQNIASADRYSARRSSDSMINVVVELVQSLGDRSLVIGKTENGAVIRFLVPHESGIKPDQTAPVFVDGRKIHLFGDGNDNILSPGRK